MEYKEVIENRRSIRKYLDKEVSEKQVSEILKSARIASSAKNRQPWRFVVLRSKKKNDVADIMIAWVDETKFKSYKLETGQTIESSIKSTAKAIKQAPVFILIYWIGPESWRNSDILSIGGAVEHMCLTATDMELSTAVSIGYAGETPKQRPRMKMEGIIIEK